MPSISSWLSDLSRRKLHVAASSRDGLRDTVNLRRFVLLKNSITNAESPSPSSSPPYSQHSPFLSSDNPPVHAPVVPEVCILSASNVSQSNTSSQASEEKWLESVLENLDDHDCEVEVKVAPVEEELAFLGFGLDGLFESWVSPYDEYDENDSDSLPFSFPPNDSSSVLPSMRSPTSLQLLSSPKSPLILPFIESRYPEADFDLPSSEASSDDESDDDDGGGPLTPHGGSQSSLREQSDIRPDLYRQLDSYFLYPSELDLTSPPTYFRQC